MSIRPGAPNAARARMIRGAILLRGIYPDVEIASRAWWAEMRQRVGADDEETRLSVA
jgi:hypothetical protein